MPALPVIAAFVAALSVGLTLAGPGQVRAQEVSPRWTFAGRGLLANEGVWTDDAGDPEWTWVNPADTHVMTRVDQLLFGETVGSFSLGARLTEPHNPLWPIFLHQAEARVAGRHVVAIFGRGRRPVTGVEFPTLRDEDLLTFVYPLNPYSFGGLEEDALFSDRLVTVFRWDFRWHVLLFGEALRDTVATGSATDASRFQPNGGGLRLFYQQVEGLAKVVRVKYAGVGAFVQRLGDYVADARRDVLVQVNGGLVVNLFPDPIHLVDLRVYGLYQHGGDGSRWAGVTDAWRSRYVATAAALRYLWAPYQLERLQLAVSGGYRRDLAEDTDEWRVIPSVVWNVGVGVSLAAQYAYSHRGARLVAATGAARDEHVLTLAFVYDFAVHLNDRFTVPEDILNAVHGYVPPH